MPRRGARRRRPVCFWRRLPASAPFVPGPANLDVVNVTATKARPSAASEAKARGAARRVVGHGSIYVVGTILQRGLSLLLLPAVTRVLSVDEFGLVGTASALAACLAIVLGLGLNFAIVRTYYDDTRDSG